MAKFFDENGNEVEAFSKEDLDKAVSEAKATKVEVKPDETPKPAELPKEVLETINRLSVEVSGLKLDKYASMYAGNDPEKVKNFKDSYNKLTGYAVDDAGLEMRAKDAAKLAFGSDAVVDVSEHAGGGQRSVDSKPAPQATADDKAVQAALGITPQDAEKYGKKAE